ncbi:MAG: CRISPR-associated endonuclease Cas2 [Epulopiscium sp. Nele67-Bin004]|nr:MAG: CRISPR-associated endonuclease Cas2 [Epulopiscium sp. Nele67-Bin004]
MYVIVTYDVEEKRVNKVRKHLKKYLTWVQNSVFEGEISDALMYKCLTEMKKMTDSSKDSIYIYKVKNPRNMEKQTIGIDKNLEDIFF